MQQQQKVRHLLWRFGFGPQTATWRDWQNLTPQAAWQKLKAGSAAVPVAFDVADSAVKGLLMGVGETAKMERRDLERDDKKEIRTRSRENIKSLNALWINEMVDSKAQLREKMAFFWHGHFASRNFNILYQQQLLQVIREHALGNFKDLLTGVSRSAAMLAFLNNQQNKKEHPNENFAREVMELFTLGRGHYTEKDVQEAARAFTGWGFRLNGEFMFKRRDHDTGTKTVLGKTGDFDGDDVLAILLEQPQTARFITRKLYRFLVNDEQIPEERIQQLGDLFFKSGYNISALLDTIAGADWFYEPANTGRKIKSPIELWVGIRRTIPLDLDHTDGQLLLQRALGQVLFYPPNVAGWPGGRNWIDTASLMLRLRLPHIIAGNESLDLSPKDDDDVMMGQKGQKMTRKLALNADFRGITTLFSGAKDDTAADELAAWLWQTPDRPARKVLDAHTNHSSRELLIKTTVLQLMATPEYQLC